MAAIQALQQWCKQQCEGYRDVSITNMTTSFRDGLAFCAILHRHRPDLINFSSLSKENIYENNELAFRVAEEELGIPALLDAEDMVALRVPDRLSILTYVSQYYNYFHGRSPIGGMSGIKRPPSQPSEEPTGKKIVSEPVPPVKPARSYLSPGPKAEPARHGPSLVKENPPVTARQVLGERENTRSSNCAICGNHVHLVQRYLMEGKLYHRNCFRCSQCSNTLQSGQYKTGTKPGTFVCNRHEQPKTVQNSSPVNSRGISRQMKPTSIWPPTPDKGKEQEPGFLSQESPRTSRRLQSSNTAKETSPQLAGLSDSTCSSTSPSSRWSGLVGNKPSPSGPSTTSPALSQWTASSAKTQQAREKFFQSGSPASGADSDAREKDKARSFLMNAIPGSSHSNSPLNGKSNAPSSMPGSNMKTSPSVSPLQRLETKNTMVGKIARPENLPRTAEEPGKESLRASPKTEQPPKEQRNRVDTDKIGQNKSKDQPVSRPANFEHKLDARVPKAGQIGMVEERLETPADWRARLKPVALKVPSQAEAKASYKSVEHHRVTLDISVSPAKNDRKKGLSVMVPANQNTAPLTDKHPQKKLLVPPLEISSSWQKAKQQWEDNPVTQKVETRDPPKKVVAPIKPSPPRMFPKHLDHQVKSPIQLHPDYIPEEEIQREVQRIEKDLDKLELKGIAMEKQLRACEGDDTEDALMVEWFKLIHEKQLLLRQESELMHKMNQQKLEEKQWDIGSELRRLMNKPDSQKTAKDKAREEELLNLYVATVNDRNKIVEDLDEDRIREQEEDEMLAAMIQKLDGRSHTQENEKKKSKFGLFNILKSKS